MTVRRPLPTRLHISGMPTDATIDLGQVVAVLDAAAIESTEEGRRWLSLLKSSGEYDVSGAGGSQPRSYVVTASGVWASSFAPSTLRRQARQPF